MSGDIVIIVPLGLRSPEGEPTPVATIQLVQSSLSANEGEGFSFQIQRSLRTDQVVDVDWSFTNVSVSPLSGIARFQLGESVVQVNVVAQQVSASELGTLALTNPVRISGPAVDPVLGTPSNISVNIFDSTAVTEQELRDFGYLLPEDYGALGNNSHDDTVAINLAIKAGHDSNRTVVFQAGKTYVVSNTIRIGEWFCGGVPESNSSTFSSVVGLGRGVNRARIRLENGATNFGNANAPRPVVCARNFDCFGGTAYFPNTYYENESWPSDPLAGDAKSANMFETGIENLIIDCGNNDGAFGIYAPIAQDTFMADIEVDCSNAFGGIWGFPGRNSCTTNIKVIGGVWQIREVNRGNAPAGEGSAGVIIAGLELVGDSRTTTPIVNESFIPMTIVGFDITRTNSGSFVETQSDSKAIKAVVMIDGIVRSSGGRFFDNSNGKNCYLRNVYITGTNDVIQSGGMSAYNSVAGTWKRINEYAYNEPLTYNASAGRYPNYSLINGSITGPVEHEPVVDIDSNVAAPTVDYIARHTIDIWRLGDGPYVNIEDYGAVSGPEITANNAYGGPNNWDANTEDSLSAIQSAISAAATAGHNRVFVPRGFYYVGSPGVQLGADTKMFGVHHLSSRIGCHASWQPTSQVWVVTSADDANGTAHFSGIAIATRQIDPNYPTTSSPAAYDNFSWLHWRTGKNSSTVRYGIAARQFVVPDNLTNKKTWHTFSGNAGGKHYSLMSPGRFTNHPDFRAVTIDGTSQPLHLYGCNTEGGKKRTSPFQMDLNVEIQNSANVRIYASKREGDAATVRINDSANICWYGLGRQIEGQEAGFRYTCGIFGTSDDILIAPCTFDEDDASVTAVAPMLEENLDTEPQVQIDWPFGVSYYKRGSPDDSLVSIDSSSVIAKRWHPGHGVKTDGDSTDTDQAAYWLGVNNKIADEGTDIPELHNAMISVAWGSVNTTGSTYDWTYVEQAFQTLAANGVYGTFQLKYKNFRVTPGLLGPADLMSAGEYVTNTFNTVPVNHMTVWRPAIMDRFIAFAEAFLERYGDNPWFEMLAFNETSPTFGGGFTPPSDYSKAGYAVQLKRLYAAAQAASGKVNIGCGITSLSDQEPGLLEEAYQLRAGRYSPDIRDNPTHDMYEGVSPDQLRDDYYGSLICGQTVSSGDWGGPILTLIDPANVVNNLIPQRGATHIYWVTSSSNTPGGWTAIKAAIQANPNTYLSNCPRRTLACEV
jgi:hypothetical protein